MSNESSKLIRRSAPGIESQSDVQIGHSSVEFAFLIKVIASFHIRSSRERLWRLCLPGSCHPENHQRSSDCQAALSALCLCDHVVLLHGLDREGDIGSRKLSAQWKRGDM